jgi:plasmid replication initiation protein
LPQNRHQVAFDHPLVASGFVPLKRNQLGDICSNHHFIYMGLTVGQAAEASHQLDLIPLNENTPKLRVAKANALVEAQFELTSQEHKLLLVAMAQIRKDQTQFHEQVFQVQDLVEHLELNPKNAYRDLRRISKGIMSKQVTIRNDDTGEWRMYQWVSKAYCERGTFGIKFSEELKPFLIGLVGRFTLYELGRILRMKSNYAIRLYELFQQYRKFGNRVVGLDPKLAARNGWDNFSKLMGYNHETYERFANLNQKVLQPAIAQIEQFTEFKKVYVKKIKHGRKTVALEFEWKTIDTLEDLPNHPLYSDLRALGVTDATCREIFSKFDEDRIVRNLALAKAHHRSQTLSNPAGWFVTAVRENYADPELPLDAIAQDQDPKTESTKSKPEHPLFHDCATPAEFRNLVAAEKERGERFSSYSEFLNYSVNQQVERYQGSSTD